MVLQEQVEQVEQMVLQELAEQMVLQEQVEQVEQMVLQELVVHQV